MKEKSSVDSPYFGAFPSDRIPKATKVVNVHFFIRSSNFCKLYKFLQIITANSGNFLKLLREYTQMGGT
jgi:hypothetical protein